MQYVVLDRGNPALLQLVAGSPSTHPALKRKIPGLSFQTRVAQDFCARTWQRFVGLRA
jgi:hypothetical protein